MNKTISYIVIGAIAIVGISGAVLLIALDKDAAPLITMVGTTLAVGVSAAVTLSEVGKVRNENQSIIQQNEKISRSVNGNTTKLLGMVDTASLSVDELDEYDRISADNDALVSGGEGKHVSR